MPESIRCFIAVDLTNNIKNHIQELQNNIKPLDCDINWVDHKITHWTLKFLGVTVWEKTPEIIAKLNQCACMIKPFTIETGQLGAFPDIGHPQILWVELQSPDEGFHTITKNIETGLSDLGYKKESRAFQAHVTIGRVKSRKNYSSLKIHLENYKISTLKQRVDKIMLYKSTLSPQGPIYNPLQEIFLNP